MNEKELWQGVWGNGCCWVLSRFCPTQNLIEQVSLGLWREEMLLERTDILILVAI